MYYSDSCLYPDYTTYNTQHPAHLRWPYISPKMPRSLNHLAYIVRSTTLQELHDAGVVDLACSIRVHHNVINESDPVVHQIIQDKLPEFWQLICNLLKSSKAVKVDSGNAEEEVHDEHVSGCYKSSPALLRLKEFLPLNVQGLTIVQGHTELILEHCGTVHRVQISDTDATEYKKYTKGVTVYATRAQIQYTGHGTQSVQGQVVQYDGQDWMCMRFTVAIPHTNNMYTETRKYVKHDLRRYLRHSLGRSVVLRDTSSKSKYGSVQIALMPVNDVHEQIAVQEPPVESTDPPVATLATGE